MEFIDQYQIQGIDVHDICREFGTPLYVYDADIIKRQISQFRQGFSQVDLKIKYACKSLTNLSIMKFMHTQGTGLDTVSIPEIKMGLRVGFKPEDIMFTPNCVDFSEIEEGVDLSVRINLENMPNLLKFAEKYGNSIPCSIRLNPHAAAQKNKDKAEWWHKQSKFGISLELLEQVKEFEEKYNLNIQGIHIHSSSVIMTPEIFINGAKAVFDTARQFQNLEFIDFGGGIKVDVGDGKQAIDVVDLGRKLDPVFQDFCKEYGRKLELWFEPGRFLVSDCGILFTRANVIKENMGTWFVGVNSGLNHLIRPMMYDAYHEIVNVSNPTGEMKKYTVVGNICEIDNLGKDRFLNLVREHDIIAIKNAGAYGFSMSSQYNSRFRPAEVFVIDGHARLIRKRETMEDLLRNQVEIEI
ncbi:MAG: diaminopimelate decarboxylase [Desulfobacteraceae bacterium]|nr:diaminopimelate decarboxylase [Desulfobacteraceae bacterium]